jgi:benzil reductase ((S)-benzoin forming)
MHHFFLTGISRGIGAALAAALIGPEKTVYGFSRQANEDLPSLAQKRGGTYHFRSLDLSEPEAAAQVLKEMLGDVAPETVSSLTLIHNAGSLSPIMPVGGEASIGEIARTVQVNLTAPLLLTQAFVAQVQTWVCPKRVLTISSGAARKPVPSWSAYCSSKAGLDMYMRTLAAEQSAQTHPVKAVALAPGVVDTEMQDYIRAQSEAVFPGVQRFLNLKTEGKLWSPAYVAEHTLRYLAEPDFGSEVIADLREYVKG